MKKLSLKVAVVVAFVAVAGYGVYSSQKSNTTMSELALANVEALASGEGTSSDCSYYCIQDNSCTCIISFGSGIDGITCYGYRGK